MDWALFHALNTGVAVRDWLEDPVTLFAPVVVPLYALATIGLWFLSRPYASARWKLACVSALTAAGTAMLANQLISHLWERPRPYTTHPLGTHLLAAASGDPSFPSDHAAAAFAIAFAVFAFSRRAGALFLAGALLIGLSRIALGLHYPGDVVAGLLVGLAAALLVTRAGGPTILRLTSVLGRLTDPLLLPVWHRVRTTLRARPPQRRIGTPRSRDRR